ncbi:hypothetical protein [Streptomyces sp. NPDC006368]|uniref:hypothetical protein n=1 Tax=Streptomyces sp. NPDC006368 TaxID=3156760 RepID=UPI0033B00B69
MENVGIIITSATAILSLFLAGCEHWAQRRLVRTERERIAQQDERLSNAATAAFAGAETADLIVQRAKDPEVPMSELQTMSRQLRFSLRLLHQQLEDERKLLDGWQFDHLMTSAAPDRGAPGTSTPRGVDP